MVILHHAILRAAQTKALSGDVQITVVDWAITAGPGHRTTFPPWLAPMPGWNCLAGYPSYEPFDRPYRPVRRA